MNALPLLIGGAIIFVVMQSKKSTSVPKSKEIPKEEIPKDPKEEIPKPKEYPTVGSKTIGYEIINCNSVIIYDAPTALNFAFNTGKTLPKKYQYNSADLIKKLFGKCLINLSLKKDQSDEARFLFDLMKYGYSGIFLTVGGNESIVTNPLMLFKQELEEKFGIDTSKFVIEVIMEP